MNLEIIDKNKWMPFVWWISVFLVWLLYKLNYVCLLDCGDKICLNGGHLDTSTCNCVCPDLYKGSTLCDKGECEDESFHSYFTIVICKPTEPLSSLKSYTTTPVPTLLYPPPWYSCVCNLLIYWCWFICLICSFFLSMWFQWIALLMGRSVRSHSLMVILTSVNFPTCPLSALICVVTVNGKHPRPVRQILAGDIFIDWTQ